MSDPRSTLERELDRLAPPRIPFDRLINRRDRKRRNQRIRAGVLGLAIAIAGGWLGLSAIRSMPPVAVDDPTPRPTPTPTPVWSPVHERNASVVHRGLSTWNDHHDTPVGWVHVRRLGFYTFA